MWKKLFEIWLFGCVLFYEKNCSYYLCIVYIFFLELVIIKFSIYYMLDNVVIVIVDEEIVRVVIVG